MKKYVLASTTFPKFKLSWIEDEGIKQQAVQWLKSEVGELSDLNSSCMSSESEGKDTEDDFL